MKKLISTVLVFAAGFVLSGATFSEQMAEADKLYKAKKYKEAAAAYDDASLETEKAAERIKARFRSFESLAKTRSGETLATAENLLYDEVGLTPDQVVKLTKYIVNRGNGEQRRKALESGLKRKDFSELYRSRILLLAINNSGSFNSEKYVDEILTMTSPDPEAKAHAFGHRANICLWVKKDYPAAIDYIGKCLEIKQLSRDDRQFFTLVKARAHLRMRQIQQAESCYLHAISCGGSRSFLNAAYRELMVVYARSGQAAKIEPLLHEAAKNKRLSRKQREEFSNIIAEIAKRRAARAQQNGESK